MIELNMSDVISVLNSCRSYLIALAVVIVLAVIVMIACGKQKKPVRGLIRGNALIAMILAVLVVANLICTGPMSTLLSL